MRDIHSYEKNYINEPFEDTMADIRRHCVVAQMGDTADKCILEVGCGMHPLFKDIGDYKKMVIVEPSENFVANATGIRDEYFNSKNICITHGFLEDKVEELSQNAFDIIVISSLLHELDDPAPLLSATRRLCSKDTIVHINVPNAKSIHRLIAYESGMIDSIYERSNQQIKMQRYNTYDMEILHKIVTEAGFEVLSDGSYFIKPFTHLQMQKCLDDGIIDQQVLTGLEKITKYLPDYGTDIYVNVRYRY